MPYSLVIFDLYGTLADSFPWFLRNVNGIELTLLGRAVRPHFEEIEKRTERIRKISSHLANAGKACR